MKLSIRALILFCFAFLFFQFSACQFDKGEIDTQTFLNDHITWLAADEREGRLAGSRHEAAAANYIEKHFLQYGLNPGGDDGTYIQQFTLTGPMPQAMNKENYISRNVVGIVNGTESPGQYIIVGAHYDGQGTGDMISMNHGDEPAVHNSADDNASGTAGLLWLAQTYAENPPEKSVVFAAFSGEEMGLLGSRHYASNMNIERDSVVAMINLDMIGRLDGRELLILGTGTSPQWDEILDGVTHDSLTVSKSQSGLGASDHTSFYEIEIPVLHYFSGTHDQYHRENDTSERIDLKGMEWILEHLIRVIDQLAKFDVNGMEFSKTQRDQSSTMTMDSVTLGVIPDYTYSGDGFRISSVQPGGPADTAGIEGGDVILQMGEVEISDIYKYMEALGGFESGDSTIVKLRRSEEIVELTVNF